VGRVGGTTLKAFVGLFLLFGLSIHPLEMGGGVGGGEEVVVVVGAWDVAGRLDLEGLWNLPSEVTAPQDLGSAGSGLHLHLPGFYDEPSAVTDLNKPPLEQVL
jgi:hypothetical protein